MTGQHLSMRLRFSGTTLFTSRTAKNPIISKPSQIPINLQEQELTSKDYQVMETRQPAGEVHYLPDGRFIVQACHLDVDFCPPVHVSTEATAAECRSSSTLIDVVDAIDSDDDDDCGGEDLLRTSANTQRSDAALLDEAINAVANADEANAENEDASSTSSSDSDDEEMQTTPPVLLRRSRVNMPNAALDLCLTADLSNMSATDSSSSEEELDDDDDEDGEDSEETESEDDSDNELVGRRTVHKNSAPRVSTWASGYVPLDQVDNLIRLNMMEIEAKKPWRFVFRCLNVPFEFKRSEDAFDVFFMRWDEFWRVHGRAVWERAFWQPLLPRSTEYYRRKRRQSRAQRAFRELATDLMKKIGDRYRRALVKTLHDGWWYRTEPFPLRRLFLKDRHLYEEYLMRRVKERWPRGKKFLLERGLKPMWCLPDSIDNL